MNSDLGGSPGKTYHFDGGEDDVAALHAAMLLNQGDASSLIGLLEQETGSLHPILQANLAMMLRDTHRRFSLRLVRKGKGAPKRDWRLASKSDAEIEVIVDTLSARHGRDGMRKNVIADAAKAAHTTTREIHRALARQRAFRWRVRHHASRQ